MAARILVILIAAASLAAQSISPNLKNLEDRGEAEFSRKDCPSAEKTYKEALQTAQTPNELPRTALYHLRIANCRFRVGDFPTALEGFREGAAVADASGDFEMLALNIHGEALQLWNMGQSEEARPLVEREYALALKCGHPRHVARGLWMMSGIFLHSGRTRDQIAWLNRALVLSRTTSDTSMTAIIYSTLSIAYGALGDLETAEHMEREILTIPAADIALTSTTYSRAITYNNLGDILVRMGRTKEARICFELAVEGSADPDRWRVHATALLNLAGIQNKAGEIEDADRGFNKALKIIESVNSPDLRCAAWKMRSDDLFVRGDPTAAAEAGREALRLARGVDTPNRIYNALVALGVARAGEGRFSDARPIFDEAIGIAETIRAQSPGEFSDLSRSYANLAPVYRASVKNLLDLHLPAEALARAEEAKARVLVNILVRGGADESASITAEEAAMQVALRKRLGAAQKQQPSEAANALVEYRQFRRTLYENHPELAIKSADFEPADLARLSGLLTGPASVLLDYFALPSGVELFVVRPGHISTYLLPDPQHTLAGQIRSFRQSLAARDLGYKSAARQLFNRLLAPAMVDLKGSKDWIISPDGPLWEAPFGALIDPAGLHVMETRAIALAPSLTAALAIRDRTSPADPNGLSLLALGNPLPSPVSLPDAAREVAEIGAHYSRPAILTGTSATEEAFRSRAASARIIHLAAHASLNNLDPLSSFVQLAREGSISALSLMSLRLHADMVVLSACETALGTSGAGEGIMGMGWALSAAGAQSSVLSLWKIDSAGSRAFMNAFYDKLARGGTRSQALRQAGLQMMRVPEYRHPFYWAAFTLQGR